MCGGGGGGGRGGTLPCGECVQLFAPIKWVGLAVYGVYTVAVSLCRYTFWK